MGREHEMEILHHAYADVLAGAGVAVFVHGESGVGKSVFARSVAEKLREGEPPPLVLYGRCYEREATPFKAFGTVIEGVSHFLAEQPRSVVEGWLPVEGAGLLPTIFQELARVEAIAKRADVASVDPTETRRRVFVALRELLASIASSRRIVIVIDDLQWADADSFELLAELTRPPSAPWMLLVCTMRVGSETARRGSPTAEGLAGDVRAVTLERLGESASTRVVEDLFARRHRTVDPATLRSLLGEAKGHPMFLVELVRQRMGSSVVAPALKLDDALRSRVSGLPSRARSLLEIVCLAGLAISQETAGRAAALGAEDLSSAVTLLRAENLVQTRGARRKDQIEPYHDRIREAVVASLDAERLKEHHGRIALAIEQSSSPDPEMLAHHWLESGSGARAAKNAAIAAERAGAALAFDRAARLYALALRFAEPETREAIDLRLKLADALTKAGKWSLAAEHRLAVAERVDRQEALSLRRLAAEQLLASGHFDRGKAILDALMKSLGVFVPRSPIVIILGVLLARLLLRLRGLRYVERAESAVSPRDLARIDVVMSAGFGLAMNDNILASYFMGRGALLALGAGEPHRIVLALAMSTSFNAVGGKKTLAQTRKLLGATEAAAKRTGTPLGKGLVCHAGAWPLYFTGSFKLAKRSLLIADAIYREQCVGVTWLQNTLRGTMARVLVMLGDLAELEKRTRPWLREADAIGDVYTATNLRAGALVMIRLGADRPDLALEDLAWVAKRLPKSRFLIQHWYHLNARVNVALYEGRGEAALAEIDATATALGRSLLMRVVALRTSTFDHDGRAALAVAAAVPARREAMLERAEQNAARLERERMDMSDGYAALLRAGIARARGKAGEACVFAESAHTAFLRADMTLHAAAALYAKSAVVGGEVGKQMSAEAVARMDVEGVRAPGRFAAMLAPGRVSPRSD